MGEIQDLPESELAQIYRHARQAMPKLRAYASESMGTMWKDGHLVDYRNFYLRVWVNSGRPRFVCEPGFSCQGDSVAEIIERFDTWRATL